MPDVVALLQIDHYRMAKLLQLVERQATSVAHGGPVNYRLLESAFDYLSTYPDQCHHPKEDLVYRKLVSRHPEMAESVADMVKEHETLADLTHNVMRAVRAPDALANNELARQLAEFVSFYRRHMLMEDRHFFPAALERLSRVDLEEIDFALFDAPDPLVDEESEARFGELREELMQLGLAEEASDDQRVEAALLATVQDVATFNEAMRQSGEAARLTRSSPAGYDLAYGGNDLLHIPACSESRAAWCAYFFWKATSRKNPASNVAR
jgi:hemerythrin-like domain-containing protein